VYLGVVIVEALSLEGDEAAFEGGFLCLELGDLVG